MDAYHATDMATRHHLDLSKDFFALSPFEVGRVLEAANEWKYRKPTHANGSRGRYFFAYLQRTAHRHQE